MRKLYWYISAYLRKHGWQFLLALLSGIAIFSFLVPWLIRTLTRQETYYIGIVGEYQLYNLPSLVKEQLSPGLMEIDDDGSFIPDLAEKVIIENDGQRYRIILPENLLWQNGQRFATTDFNYQLKDVTVTKTQTEVIYDLPAPYASFPQYLVEPILLPSTVGWSKFFQEETLIGLNNVEISKIKYTDGNKNNIREIVLDDLAEKKRYVYRFYFTQNQAMEAFKLGEIDYLFDVTNAEEIAGWSNVAINERENEDQYLAVFFNSNAPLMTKNLRLALSYAINKEYGGLKRALGPISESSWAFLKGVKPYDQNYQTAVERLLDELPGEPIELELVSTSSYYEIAQNIKHDWEELGERAATACLEDKDIKDKKPCEYLRLKVKLQIQNFPDLNNFQTLLVGQEVSLDPDQYSLWHSGLATNFTGYKNTKVDSLLEKGRQTLDQKERLTIYQEFQQTLLEDPPAVFLWYLRSSDLVRK